MWPRWLVVMPFADGADFLPDIISDHVGCLAGEAVGIVSAIWGRASPWPKLERKNYHQVDITDPVRANTEC